MAEDDAASEEQTSAVEDLAIGTVAPDFLLSCKDGKEHRLSDFRGSKVLLCFYRFSYCSQCAYSVGRLIGSYKKLAWAAKLKVITVFQTDQEWMQKGLTNSNAPIAGLCDEGCYPFLALADPDRRAASTFQVESHNSPLLYLFKFVADIPTMSKMHGTCTATGVFHDKNVSTEAFGVSSDVNLLPSEFLINEDGVIIDVLRAKNVLDSMDTDRIVHFLLLGEKLSPKDP